jgi:asparagine synthetase B (glutamine-hydrolysing)
MREILNYNFNQADLLKSGFDFKTLYGQVRRDAIFAYVFEKDEKIYALRDHLGVIPLYYKKGADGYRFSVNLSELADSSDEIDEAGLKFFLKLKTAKIKPLYKNIGLVPPGTVLEIDRLSGEIKSLFCYRIIPQKISPWQSLNKLTLKLEQLFLQALKRQLKHKTVGLYLSGGIDSGLIGIYLKKLGVEINAYTSAPWGYKSAEIGPAKLNAQIIKPARQTIDCLETSDYQAGFLSLPQYYKNPNGQLTSLALVHLWENSKIAEEQQIFFGQNCDIIGTAMDNRFIRHFGYFLPRRLRKKLNLDFDKMLNKFLLSFTEENLIVPDYFKNFDSGLYNNWQLLTLAGLYLSRTPGDGEMLAQPILSRNIIMGNPYYDLDLIEFALGVPLPFRLNFNSRTFISVGKKIFKRLAMKHLPQELVNRKKGFNLPLKKVEEEFTGQLPEKLFNLPLNDLRERFAGAILKQWLKR